MELIKLEEVKKSYAEDKPSLKTIFSPKKQKRIVILDNISFEVEEGELLGIMGKNGAGKSTLLRLIGGVYEKDSGNIITRGDIVSIFEMGSFFNIELTGEQYCRDYLIFRGLKGEALVKAIKSIHEFTELDNFFFEPVKTYSTGMQSRVLFGAATAIPAKIILIDEFLVVGDEYFQHKAWKRLNQFLSMGATGIVVSHDWTSILKLCKRSVIISGNHIEFLGPTYEAVQKYLNIQYNKSNEVTFFDKEKLVQEEICCKCGDDFIVDFKLGILKEIEEESIGIAFSIERHIEGIGWSLVITGNETLQVNKLGVVEISIKVEDFCIAPGDYLLCLFISSPLGDLEKTVRKTYESLTWLNGYPIKLKVLGDSNSKQLIKKRLKWKIKLV